MIDEHVHCALCYLPVATQIKVAGGKTKPAEVKQVTERVIRPAPQGLVATERKVPVCDECFTKIEEAEKAAAARSRIVVPGIATPQ